MQVFGKDRAFSVWSDILRGVADGTGARLRLLRAVASRPRYRLLQHAVEVGDFTGTDAAAIAGSTRGTGTGRSTHAEGLRKLGLLRRLPGRPARYRATPKGRTTFASLKAALLAQPPVDPSVLARDGSIVITLPLESPTSKRVVVRLEREQ